MRPRGPAATRLDGCEFKRRAAAVIGIAGAIGAFGGFLIQLAFRQASLDVTAAVEGGHDDPAREARGRAGPRRLVDPGAVGFPRRLRRASAAMTWFFYLRRALRRPAVPSLAHASV